MEREQHHVEPTSDPGILAAYPTLRAAAHIVGVDVSTLSRRRDLPTEMRGTERRVRPRVVIDLARFYRRRPLSVVASEILDYAYEHAEAYAGLIDAEVEASMGPWSSAKIDASTFLAEARRALPAELFRAVEIVYRDAGGLTPPTGAESHRARGSVAHRG